MKTEKQKDCTDIAFNLFNEICSKFSLSYEQNKDAPVELCLNIPKQKGLEFNITLMLQNQDELWLTTDGFTMSVFPCYKTKVLEEFKNNTINLLTGKARIVKFLSKNNQIIKSELQTFDGNDWKYTSLYGRNILGMIIAKIFPSTAKKQILQNTPYLILQPCI